MPAVIYAFDGGLARNTPLRVHALVDAAAAESQQLDATVVAQVVPGRTFLEASLALFPEAAASDPTLPELIALRAQRGYRALVQHGVPLAEQLLLQLHTASTRGDRIVIRADSERRDVEPLLTMAGLEHVVSLVRCSDDAPRAPGRSVQRSWEAIDARLGALQVTVTSRTAYETSSDVLLIAQQFSAQTHLL